MMDTGCDHQEGVSNNLRKQLAFAVRSIQWSYAIFWSISSKNPGVLEWVDGHYNGDVKTRKTIQAAEVEVDADEMGLRRSEQLRELYESFKAEDSTPQARRPSAALSPEDLTEPEWYYLVCMSFTFNIGQGLPGRTYTKNQTIWLCNAHQADTKTFTRSLLAKSASIQTIVCFPYLGGVIELGVTEQVLEDPKLIQHIKTSFLEIPYPAVGNISGFVSDNARNDEDVGCASFDHALLETDLGPLVEGGDVIICSPNNSSNGFVTNKEVKDSYLVEGINGEASQVQSWNLLDNEFDDHVHNSINSSDSLSQTYAEKISLASNGKGENVACLRNIKECDKKERNSFDPRGKDFHYQCILSNLLKSSHQLILGPYFRTRNKESSFTSWKKEALWSVQKPRSGSPQRLLKKVLFEVAKMHGGSLIESSKDNGIKNTIWQQEVDKIDQNHVFSEKKRKEKINERFKILSSLVPTNGKIDKISILDDTIAYLKDLESRIDELESHKEVLPKTRRKHRDAVERTSDKYGNNKTENRSMAKSNKRKVCNMDVMEPLNNRSLLRGISTDEVSVSMVDHDIMIEMSFPWRNGVLLEIMEVISNLHLDSHAIQSTNSEGILSVTIKSKLKGSKLPSEKSIKQALQRVIRSCQSSSPQQFHS